MSHWIIVPIVLPAMLAPLIGFVMRHDIVLARIASTVGTVLLLGVCIGLAAMAADGDTHIYRLGDWPAPFGIVLVLDRLSALMILLTASLAMMVLLHGIATGWLTPSLRRPACPRSLSGMNARATKRRRMKSGLSN